MWGRALTGFSRQSNFLSGTINVYVIGSVRGGGIVNAVDRRGRLRAHGGGRSGCAGDLRGGSCGWSRIQRTAAGAQSEFVPLRWCGTDGDEHGDSAEQYAYHADCDKYPGSADEHSTVPQTLTDTRAIARCGFRVRIRASCRWTGMRPGKRRETIA